MAIKGKDVVKGIAKFVGSFGVGALVSIGVKQNIIPKSLAEKILIGIGSFVLSDMISAKAEEHIDEEVDKLYDLVESLRGEPVKEIKEIDVTAIS